MTCFFVGGINRSGTTLLQSILCSDSATNPLIHEASYFRSIVQAYAAGKQKFEEHGKYYFSSIEEMRDFTGEWAKRFLDLVYRKYPESRHLVLKHPPLTQSFPLILELMNSVGVDVRFFIIVRDPRDVIASLVRVGERLRRQGDPEGNTLPRDMARLAGYYLQTYAPALSSTDSEYRKQVHVVRYEDLVQDPGAVITVLREASGLSLDRFDAAGDWSSDDMDYRQLQSSENAWLSELWGKKISAARVGSYRDVLGAEEVRVIEQTCADLLQTFGYR